MKKIFVCVTVAVFFVMMPFVLFAKSTITEGEMGAITAQEGVDITFGGTLGVTAGGLNVFHFAPALQSWGDADGFAGYTDDAGWVGVLTTMDATSAIMLYDKMTIDVGTNGSGVTAVNIGLPQVLVHPIDWNQTIKLGTSKDLSGTQTLGSSWMSQFAIIANMNSAVGGSGGSLTITNHSGASQGVDVAFGGTPGALAGLGWGNGLVLAIPATAITQSWGDSDGFAGYESAGYVGARNMTMAEGTGGLNNYFWILLSGSLSVDVGTDDSGTTAVGLSLPTTNIYTSGITQPLVLSDAKTLTGTQVLGTSFMGGLQATIIPGNMTLSAH